MMLRPIALQFAAHHNHMYGRINSVFAIESLIFVAVIGKQARDPGIVFEACEHLCVGDVGNDGVQFAGDQALRHISGFVDILDAHLWIMNREHFLCV